MRVCVCPKSHCGVFFFRVREVGKQDSSPSHKPAALWYISLTQRSYIFMFPCSCVQTAVPVPLGKGTTEWNSWPRHTSHPLAQLATTHFYYKYLSLFAYGLIHGRNCFVRRCTVSRKNFTPLPVSWGLVKRLFYCMGLLRVLSVLSSCYYSLVKCRVTVYVWCPCLIQYRRSANGS